MIYELYGINQDNTPIRSEAPEVVCHSKEAVDTYIAEQLEKDGLDWRCGSVFQTRMMPKPKAFFKLTGELLR